MCAHESEKMKAKTPDVSNPEQPHRATSGPSDLVEKVAEEFEYVVFYVPRINVISHAIGNKGGIDGV